MSGRLNSPSAPKIIEVDNPNIEDSFSDGNTLTLIFSEHEPKSWTKHEIRICLQDWQLIWLKRDIAKHAQAIHERANQLEKS